MVPLLPKRLTSLLKKTPRVTIIKLGGVAVAVVVMLLPLFFWPSNASDSTEVGQGGTYITVPPVAVVTSVLSEGETTTTLAQTSATDAGDPVTSITVAAVGDIIIHDSVLASAYDATRRTYDFTDTFAPIAPYLSAADYTVCNLESRMAGGTISETNDATRFNAPYSLADSLGAAGIDLVATANNHSADFGWLGITRTLNRLDQEGLVHVGTARSLDEKSTPVIVDIEGIKVAFVNYTAFVNDNAIIPGHEDYAINILEADRVSDEAEAAREQGADVVVALLHFGVEYLQTPTIDQTRIAEGYAGVEGLLSRGVDVILGSHPHVVQPIVKVVQYSGDARDTYVAYSLGNFLTGQRWRYTDSGIVAYVHIQKQGSDVSVTGISYLPVYVQKSEAETTAYRILPVLPGLTPQTDTDLGSDDLMRMNQVWDELEKMLYRPDEGIVPLDQKDLGI